MIARVRKSMDEKDKGFTLIELLVVIIIIGILAAIAIPIFLNQRRKAVDASIKSDLKTVATQAETYFTDNQTYVTASNLAGATQIAYGAGTLLTNVPITKGNVLSVKVTSTGDAYCIFGINAAGTAAATGFTYISNAGGLQAGASAVTGCGTSFS